MSFATDNYNYAHKIIDEIQDSLFYRLESCCDSSQAQALEGAIDEKIKLLEKSIDKIEILVNKSSGPQRNTMKLKLDQIRFSNKYY